jgi:hypothetical protein
MIKKDFKEDSMHKFLVPFLALVFLANPSQARGGGWSLNIGYHNPPGADVGANFLYQWSNWAFELGIGSISVSDSSTNNNNQSSAGLGGDLNLKYLFGNGGFRPYLQGGVLVGTGATVGENESTGASASTGSGFVGLGIMAELGSSAYIYLGGNAFNKRKSEFFFGLGFDI